MARVSAAEVGLIIDTDLTETVVDTFIAAANYTVTEIVGSDTTISDDHKKEIERWLSAHLIACTKEQQIIKGKAGKGDVTFQGKTGMGLNATFYGQQVLVLDTTGKMAAAISMKRASIVAATSFD
jgi:hypothetical protein